MTKRTKWIIIFANLALISVLFTNAVVKKESIIKNGKHLLLELAPADPRSLIQGDYMALSYALSSNISETKGYIIVSDSSGIAKKERIQSSAAPLADNEWAIPFRNNNGWSVSLGAQSYFFEEGKASLFEKAKYGGIVVDRQGALVLVGMYDANREKIGP